MVALILPTLTGCPQDSEDNTPGGNLVLEGTVYTTTFNESALKYEYNLYETADIVEVWASAGAASEKLGEGPLTNGKFNISVTQKPASLSSDFAGTIFSPWTNPGAEPADAKAAQISLRSAGTHGRIRKTQATASGTRDNGKETEEAVMYLYVDMDVTITLEANGDSGITDREGDEIPYTDTYNAATLKLAKGWNALYQEYEITATSSGLSRTVSVSVKNPDLYWILNTNN
jgi:hypothetical protein